MKYCGEQVRYQIFLVLVKSKSPSLSEGWGGGTWWLVTEPILTEGGELQRVLSQVKMGKCGISVKWVRIKLIGLRRI